MKVGLEERVGGGPGPGPCPCSQGPSEEKASRTKAGMWAQGQAWRWARVCPMGPMGPMSAMRELLGMDLLLEETKNPN